jgi:hypothetical protein
MPRRGYRTQPRVNGAKIRSFWDGFCPEGGYRTQPRVSTLGTLKINEFALKGREADLIKFAPIAVPNIAAPKLVCAIEACYNWIYLRVVSTFDLPPLQGASFWGGSCQG